MGQDARAEVADTTAEVKRTNLSFGPSVARRRSQVIKFMSDRRNNEDGFTLIELMIVMVVLGILAGIILFAVGNFKTDATTSKDNANTRICATAKAASQAKFGDDT